jgi:peptidoglycan/LPS O-acetylase OafA/YrhL
MVQARSRTLDIIRAVAVLLVMARHYVVGSVLLGVAIHALIEAPMLRLRDRLVPSRTRTTRQTPTTGPRLTPVTVSANAY